MWLYMIIFLIPVSLYFYQMRVGVGQRNAVQLGVYLTGLAFFVGMSDMFGGYYRYIYSEIFDSIANVTTYSGNYNVNDVFSYFPSEKGYTMLNIIISFFTENRYIFILILTLIIYSCLFVSIKRYAVNYPFAIILFLGLWFFFTFTYLRQVLGATVVWLSLPYVIDRKLWKFLLIWLLACTLHKSAVIFFPVYFIGAHVFAKDDVIKVMIIALLFGISPIPNALFSAYGDMSQVELQSDYSASGGFRIEYAIEVIFFLWIILKNYQLYDVSKTDRVLLNLSLMFCATLLFFIRSDNGGRLSWYYMIGVICTLTNIATFRINRNSIAPLLILVCFLLMARVYHGWQAYMNLYPYKTFLTDGHRKGDPVFDNYEYDVNYDGDKMYRDPLRFAWGFTVDQWKTYDK